MKLWLWTTRRLLAPVTLLLGLAVANADKPANPGGGGGGDGGSGSNSLEYNIYQLDSAGGAYSAFAADLNNVGTVVGEAVDTATGEVFAASWETTIAADRTVTSHLNLLTDSSNAHATGVNDLGEVVGDKRVAGDWLGAYWPSTTAAPLPLPPLSGDTGSRTFAINDAGIVCGASTGSGEHPVVWRVTSNDDGDPVIVGPIALPGTNGMAWDLSEADADGTVTVAGNAWDDASSAAVTWRVRPQSDGGILIDPQPTILQVAVNAYGINNTGVVCGDSSRPDWIATLWAQADEVTLALPRKFESSSAIDLNDSGVVVGWVGADGAGFPREPAAWAGPQANPILLNSFLGRRSPFEALTDAPAINQAGVIVGAGWDRNDGIQTPFIALPN